MSKSRLETFTDGVLAVIITVMVLEMRVPRATTFAALRPVLPVFLSYALSFIYIAIYWNNHHHLLQATERVTGVTLWANMHLLFWLALVPFATAWMGEDADAQAPIEFYGTVLLFAAIAYFLLSKNLVRQHAKDSALAISIGPDRKGIASIAIYAVAIPLALVHPWIAYSCYVLVAIIWLLPDPRIEKTLRG
jgi:uncharacterized membrane protein